MIWSANGAEVISDARETVPKTVLVLVLSCVACNPRRHARRHGRRSLRGPETVKASASSSDHPGLNIGAGSTTTRVP